MTTTIIQPQVWERAVDRGRPGVSWPTVESSDLLLPVGSWPSALELAGWATFEREDPIWNGDDLAGWWYTDVLGERLLVIND